jgi:hypothetical protein
MKRLLLGIWTTLALIVPASAQYYYEAPDSEPSYRHGPRPDGWSERRPAYEYETRREYRYGPPSGEWRREGRRPMRRTQVGNVCVTSRGSCEYPQYFPLNARCRCNIPGFGPKRGNILE